MKKRSFIKLLCLLVSLFLLVGMFVGCKKDDDDVVDGDKSQAEEPDDTDKKEDDEKEDEKEDETDAKEDSIFPISEEKITLTLMGRRDSLGIYDWEDLRIFKDLEDLTNIHLEFDVSYSDYGEKKTLAFATGNMPDIFMCGSVLGVADEERYGVQEGALMELTDLIEEHAPNIQKTLEEYPLLRRTMTASDGNTYALGQVLTTPTMGGYKPVINKVWLDNLGLDIPNDIDDLYDVLKAFKVGDPNQNGQNDEIPLGAAGFGQLNGILLPPFGEMAQDLAVWDGEVVFTPMREGYKHYLEFLNRLFQEELIDPMFMSHNMDEYQAKTRNNIYGLLGHVRSADWEQYQIIPPLISEHNTERFSSSNDTSYNPARCAIPTTNEYPVETIKWVDLFYTALDEGYDGITGAALWIGRRGVDWDFTDDGSAIEYLFEPEDDLTDIQTLLQTVTPTQGGYAGQLVMKVPFESPYLNWVGENNMTHVFPYIKPERVFPTGARFTNEEQEEINELRSELNSYVSTSRVEFVTGERSLAEWNEYVDNLDKIGVKRYIEINQQAYDRFMDAGN